MYSAHASGCKHAVLTLFFILQVKLVDAGFIWTEPHSRRLKTKLTVQSEVVNGAILQQTFVVEYVVETHMCPDCSRAAANPNTWTAVVQVRVLTCCLWLHVITCPCAVPAIVVAEVLSGSA